MLISVCTDGSFLFVPECGALYLGSLQITAGPLTDLFMWERYAIRHNTKTMGKRKQLPDIFYPKTRNFELSLRHS